MDEESSKPVFMGTLMVSQVPRKMIYNDWLSMSNRSFSTGGYHKSMMTTGENRWRFGIPTFPKSEMLGAWNSSAAFW